MNNLEKAIIQGAEIAQKEYSELTNWWLSHGPEYFITCEVSKNIAKSNGYLVFPEASPKKIKSEINLVKRGPVPKSDGERFDIVVWEKHTQNIRAIIEIKRSYNINPIRNDLNKVKDHLKKMNFVKNGYILAYHEAKKIETISNAFTRWSEELGCKLVGTTTGNDFKDEWKWGFGLFKA